MSVGLHETVHALRAFATEFGIEHPLWIDPGGRSPAALGVSGHPNTVLIDRAGRVVGQVRGERNWDAEARRLVEALLQER